MGECTVRSWLDAHRGQVPDRLWQRRRDEWTPSLSAAAWARTIAEIGQVSGHPSTVVVAETPDHGIIGVGMITVADRAGDVNALYVAPGRQGIGVGRAILDHLAGVAEVDGADIVDVTVLARNTPARRFYEHLGAVLDHRSTFDEEGTQLDTAVYRWSVAEWIGRVGV